MGVMKFQMVETVMTFALAQLKWSKDLVAQYSIRLLLPIPSLQVQKCGLVLLILILIFIPSLLPMVAVLALPQRYRLVAPIQAFTSDLSVGLIPIVIHHLILILWLSVVLSRNIR